MNTSPGATVASCLSLNTANSIVHALARRQVISFDDAAEILERVADATIDDCETPEERLLATACANWLKQVASSYRFGDSNA